MSPFSAVSTAASSLPVHREMGTLPYMKADDEKLNRLLRESQELTDKLREIQRQIDEHLGLGITAEIVNPFPDQESPKQPPQIAPPRDPQK
jgi:hypothetical protein